MKKLLIVICTAILFASCNQAAQQQPNENSVVYEMNVRQYTPEGTFAAAQQQLPDSAKSLLHTLFPDLTQMLKKYYLLSNKKVI